MKHKKLSKKEVQKLKDKKAKALKDKKLIKK